MYVDPVIISVIYIHLALAMSVTCVLLQSDKNNGPYGTMTWKLSLLLATYAACFGLAVLQ